MSIGRDWCHGSYQQASSHLFSDCPVLKKKIIILHASFSLSDRAAEGSPCGGGSALSGRQVSRMSLLLTCFHLAPQTFPRLPLKTNAAAGATEHALSQGSVGAAPGALRRGQGSHTQTDALRRLSLTWTASDTPNKCWGCGGHLLRVICVTLKGNMFLDVDVEGKGASSNGWLRVVSSTYKSSPLALEKDQDQWDFRFPATLLGAHGEGDGERH